MTTKRAAPHREISKSHDGATNGAGQLQLKPGKYYENPESQKPRKGRPAKAPPILAALKNIVVRGGLQEDAKSERLVPRRQKPGPKPPGLLRGDSLNDQLADKLGVSKETLLEDIHLHGDHASLLYRLLTGEQPYYDYLGEHRFNFSHADIERALGLQRNDADEKEIRSENTLCLYVEPLITPAKLPKRNRK